MMGIAAPCIISGLSNIGTVPALPGGAMLGSGGWRMYVLCDPVEPPGGGTVNGLPVRGLPVPTGLLVPPALSVGKMITMFAIKYLDYNSPISR